MLSHALNVHQTLSPASLTKDTRKQRHRYGPLGVGVELVSRVTW